MLGLCSAMSAFRRYGCTKVLEDKRNTIIVLDSVVPKLLKDASITIAVIVVFLAISVYKHEVHR